MSDSAWAEYKNINKANFAGQYNIFTFDCGTDAICGEVLDLKSGKIVTGLPDQYLSNDYSNEDYVLDIDFNENSQLIVISGRSAHTTNNKNGDTVKSMDKTSYCEFNGKQFKLLGESPR